MYKKIAMALLVFLILIKAGTATKGIGIGTVETNITLSPMEEHIFYLMLFNPSDTDSNVDLNIYCENCLQDYKVFGNYIGKVNYTVDFIEFPSSVKVEKNTSYMEGKFVEIRIRMPLFIKNQLTLPGNETISYHSLISNLNELDFKIVANAGDQTKISVVTDLRIKIKQNQAIFFEYFLIASAVLLVLFLASRRLL